MHIYCTLNDYEAKSQHFTAQFNLNANQILFIVSACRNFSPPIQTKSRFTLVILAAAVKSRGINSIEYPLRELKQNSAWKYFSGRIIDKTGNSVDKKRKNTASDA
jgi:hypothetical protein